MSTIRNEKLENAVIEMVQDVINPFDDYTNHKSRRHEYVIYRQAVMTILKNVFNYNWRNTAEVFWKNHATAMHAVRTINNLMETDAQFRDVMNEIYDRADRLPFKKKPATGKGGELCHALRQSMTDHMNKIKVKPDEKESWFVINAEDQGIVFSEEEQIWILT